MEQTQEFVTLAEACRIIGVSRMTLYRRIERAGVQVYKSPQDQRQRLLTMEDVELLSRPVPVATGKVMPAHNLAA